MNSLTRVCKECDRVFDLSDKEEADQYFFGHDCEAQDDYYLERD